MINVFYYRNSNVTLNSLGINVPPNVPSKSGRGTFSVVVEAENSPKPRKK